MMARLNAMEARLAAHDATDQVRRAYRRYMALILDRYTSWLGLELAREYYLEKKLAEFQASH